MALFYFGAFYAKWSQPDWSFDLGWAFSDNLRNSLALPYNIRGLPMPWYIALIASHPLIWQSVAFGHLLNQALPIGACFTRNPWARLAEAVIFSIGCVLLGVVMTLYNLPWIYLATFFIDWDYFLNRFRPRLQRFAEASIGGWGAQFVSRIFVNDSNQVVLSPAFRRCATLYSVLFLGFYVFIIASKTSPQIRPYPFSSMLFYSSVQAQRPYSIHQHYAYWGPQLMLARGDEEKELLRGVFGPSIWAFALTPDTDTKQAVSVINSLRQAVDRKPSDYNGASVDPAGWDELRLYIDVFHLPAYPEQPLRRIAHRGLIAVYDYKNRVVRTAKAEVGVDGHGLYLEFATEGFSRPEVGLLSRDDPLNKANPGPLLPLDGVVENNRIYFKSPHHPAYLILRVREAGETRFYDFYGAITY